MTTTEIYADFKPNALFVTYGDILLYNLDLEPWELSNILKYLKTKGTNWSQDDLTVEGSKSYDEEGNSYAVGVLQVNAAKHTRQDFQQLATLWQEAEDTWEEELCQESRLKERP